MEGFIHRENIALFRKHLAGPCEDAQRQLLLKLLAEEEAREPSFLTQHSPQSAAPQSR